MVSRIRKAALASALVATALTGASPALAGHRDYYDDYGYRHRDRGDSTGAAIVGGIVGIAIGALIASAGNKNKKHKRHRGDWEYRDGYYYDRDGRRYDRDGRPYEDGYYQRRGYGDGYGDRDDGRYTDRTYPRGY